MTKKQKNTISVLQLGKYYAPVKGGIETYLYNLCTNMPEDIKTKIIVSNLSMKTEIDRVDDIEVIRLSKADQLFSTAMNPSLPLWLRKEKADIIHIQLPNPMAVLSYLLVRPKGKLVVSYHSDILKQKFILNFYKYCLSKFLDLASAIIVATPNHITFSPFLNTRPEKCRVIHYGIDHTQFETNEVSLKKAKKIRKKYGPQPIVLFVGRLVYYKGIEYLLKAARDLDVTVLIIGNGPYYSTLKLQSMDQPNVHLLGEVSSSLMTGYYNAADIFVLPSISRAEAFGLVQLEAFSAGKPVICTDLTTGVPYVNIHNQTGLVVKPGDVTGLREAIKTLAENPDLRKKMGEKARKRVINDFTIKNMAESTAGLYRELVN
jgi:rhamnosyl/mannosyltransferase